MIIRWVSEDGKRKWLYPVQKDIHTGGPVHKQVSKEAKVIGITKVNIPSPMHPTTPYHVLLLEDAHGNRMPKKTMKAYKIGDTYKIAPATTYSGVVITKLKYDIKEYLLEALELLQDFKIEPDEKYVLKPSIIEPAYPYQAVNTNPKVIDALITILKEKGVKDIIVAEQSMPGNDVGAAAKKAGIAAVCKKHDVAMLDLSNTDYETKEVDGLQLNIAKACLERKMINVPVLKSNSQLVISGAMENVIRVVDKETQELLFSKDINKTLPSLVKVLPEFVTVGDASIGLQGQGPTAIGEPAFLNMLLVSKDARALDAVFAKVGMYDMPAYVLESGIDIDGIEVVGDELEACAYPLKKPRNDTAQPHIKLLDGRASPATFSAAMKTAGKLFGLAGHTVYLAIGKYLTKEQFDGKKRIIAFGKDAIAACKESGIPLAAELPEEMDATEKLMLIKSVVEDHSKESVTHVDKVKSKAVSFAANLQKKFMK